MQPLVHVQPPPHVAQCAVVSVVRAVVSSVLLSAGVLVDSAVSSSCVEREENIALV